MAEVDTSGKQSKIFTGARAKVYVDSQLVGLFSSVTWGYVLSAEPAYILGRFSVADIGYVAAEPVHIECSGYRVIGGKGDIGSSGPHQQLGAGSRLVPTLDELLLHKNITFHIVDRQRAANSAGDTHDRIMVVEGVRPLGYHTGVNARRLAEMTLSFMGMTVSTEDLTGLNAGNPETDASTLTGSK